MMPAMLVPRSSGSTSTPDAPDIPATTEKRSADPNGGFSSSHRHRPVLAATRRRRPLRSLERTRLRVVCGTARWARALRPLPLGTAGLPFRGAVRHRAGAGVARGRGAWRRRRRRGRRSSVGAPRALPLRGPMLARTADPRHRDCARRLLELVPEVPKPVWGRDDLHAGEMWNSNSTISWLIARSGLDVESIALPRDGRAPGWQAGIVIARRQQAEAAQSRPPATALRDINATLLPTRRA